MSELVVSLSPVPLFPDDRAPPHATDHPEENKDDLIIRSSPVTWLHFKQLQIEPFSISATGAMLI